MPTKAPHNVTYYRKLIANYRALGDEDMAHHYQRIHDRMMQQKKKSYDNGGRVRCGDRRRVKVRENKKRLVELFGSQCSVCKETFHVSAFDFHHRDPDQKNRDRAFAHLAWEDMVEEAKKCDMICSNCHRRLHYGRT